MIKSKYAYAIKESLWFTIIMVLANFLPILISLLYYVSSDESLPGYTIFYDSGQFYLYAISFLISAAYSFFTYKTGTIDRFSILFWISAFFTLFISILFTFLLINRNTNIYFLKYASITSIVFSLLLYYYSNFEQSKRIDVNAIQRQQIDEITNAL